MTSDGYMMIYISDNWEILYAPEIQKKKTEIQIRQYKSVPAPELQIIQRTNGR